MTTRESSVAPERGVRASGLGLAAALVTALVTVVLAGLFSGAFVGLVGFDDGGITARWGIPIARTVHDVTAAATIGLLLLAGTIVPERASTDRRWFACRIATWTGATWAVSAYAVLLLVVANTSGISLGAPGYWGQLSQVWTISFFRVFFLGALLATVYLSSPRWRSRRR